MEIEKSMSVLLSFHPALIDMLQYIGNLNVDFDYNQECYMLKGNWYQVLFTSDYNIAWPRGYKTFFMLNSIKHEILNAHKYKTIKIFSSFQAQIPLECYFPAHTC